MNNGKSFWIKIIALVISTTGVIGLYLEFHELRKTSKYALEQSELMRGNLKQSYRPLGIPSAILKEPDKFTWEFIEAEKENKFGIGYPQYLINKGSGVLTFLGFIAYLSDSLIDFRNEVLKGKIDDFRFDNVVSEARGYTILPNDHCGPWSMSWENLDFKNQYHFYRLYFYLDQERNLYDTQNVMTVNFKAAYIENEEMKTDVLGITPRKNDFHSYNNQERARLVSIFEEKKHNLATFLK